MYNKIQLTENNDVHLLVSFITHRVRATSNQKFQKYHAIKYVSK